MNIILPQTGNTFVAGNDVSIQCEVRGYPRPAVRWTKDDEEIHESNRIRISGNFIFFTPANKFIHWKQPLIKFSVVFFFNIAEANTLTIYSVTTEDSGSYKCSAQNRFTSAFHAEQINVESE